MRNLLYIISIAVILQSCYSFKGISIPDNIDTFDIPYVESASAEVPPAINVDFQDKLIQKITRESRLTYKDIDPDIRMIASITGYTVVSVGANAQNSVDANRLKISVKVEYIDTKDEENNWTKTFPQNREFAAGVNLLSVQDQLVDEIFTDIVEDIFNHAFTNW